jgi:hypothetical protein
MKYELANLDATEQAELVRKKEASPLELVDAAIARIQEINPQLNAVIAPLFQKARAQAKDGPIPEGPFRGVPFLLKDLVCAAVLDAIAGNMPGDPYSAPPQRRPFVQEIGAGPGPAAHWIHETVAEGRRSATSRLCSCRRGCRETDAVAGPYSGRITSSSAG